MQARIREHLEGLSKKQLKEACLELGLSGDGAKEAMIERVLEFA